MKKHKSKAPRAGVHIKGADRGEEQFKKTGEKHSTGIRSPKDVSSIVTKGPVDPQSPYLQPS